MAHGVRRGARARGLRDVGAHVGGQVELGATLTTALRAKPPLAGPQRDRLEGCRLAGLKVCLEK